MNQSYDVAGVEPTKHWWQRWWGWLLMLFGIAVLAFGGYVALLAYQISKRPLKTSTDNVVNRFTYSEGLAPSNPNGASLIRPENASLGPTDAKVTIVEFADFECPFCLESFSVIRGISADYADQVRVVYRHFPVPSLHPNAIAAAEAAACAAAQDKFWPYHDRLFQNQAALDGQSLRRYASQVGLDAAQFEECVTKRSTQEQVRADIIDGQALGVRGTPTWFVNGRRVEGAIPETVFKNFIDSLLAS